MKILARLFASFMLTIAIGSAAHAALVEWTFSAEVRDIDGNAAGMVEYGITTGTVLSATFLLDNSAAGAAIADNVWYDGAVVGVDVHAGIFEAYFDADYPEFNTVLVRDQEFDAIAASASLVIGNGTDSTVGFVALQFVGSDGLLISDTLFPSLPDFSHVDSYDSPVVGGTFFLFQASVGGVYTTVTAEIFSPEARLLPVPLPGALLLFSGGLITLLGIGKRR